ncbi:YggT family protein [Phaeovibrio sulfidiphilus]|uniref:YggT family protein n=1 Tax=Phaeovibrio sulfidiphilus TaxID=1220600 RepID=A0A8J7CNU7_9PROT|nr:YggT family protein [Phaeovibrio sulfidiphilus]MBE1236317.1 YggT family protein [Phaeovibrio sulfidiphilus]
MFLLNMILFFLILVLRLYLFALIGNAIMSWLIAFNILKTSNAWVRSTYQFLNLVTEPALRPIRRLVPSKGPVDWSALVLFVALFILLQIFKALSAGLVAAAAPAAG